MKQLVFRQLVTLLPHRVFDGIVDKYHGNKNVRSFTCWNLLLVLIYSQLSGLRSLREFISISSAHRKKCKELGFGDVPITKSNLAKALANRDYRIFEKFAYKMVARAQEMRIKRPFVLCGKYYAFDSTTIELCLNMFQWAHFREKKGGIKVHTMLDIVTQIPTFFHITDARVNDVNAMDEIPYEERACYIFDRGYYDWARYFTINLLGALFVTRQRKNIKYEIIDGEELMENEDNILFDQRIRFTEKNTRNNYPAELRRVGYYDKERKRTFIFLTNNFDIEPKYVALLYKYRWQIELFFKWLKQHLRVKTFWANNENAVRIQVYAAISAYCLVAIAEHMYGLDRSMFDILRVVGHSLLDTIPIKELFQDIETCDIIEPKQNDGQQTIKFDWS